ncbi:SPOR domain-containing protein [Peribacillus frigoritolerans]|uniref:SPOR domain-containing protein n=1 Tax=Peribacillus frigoritolerans TaxID=450367 RepID=UPI0035144059
MLAFVYATLEQSGNENWIINKNHALFKLRRAFYFETLSGKKLKEEAKPVEKKSVLHKVQVGAFTDEKNASNLAAELKKKVYSVNIVKG